MNFLRRQIWLVRAIRLKCEIITDKFNLFDWMLSHDANAAINRRLEDASKHSCPNYSMKMDKSMTNRGEAELLSLKLNVTRD